MQTEEYAKLYAHEDRYWWFVGRRTLALKLIEDFIRPGENRRLLDLGCGTGIGLKELAKYGTNFGVDFSPLALEFCRERGLERIALGNGEALPFASNSFDAIMSLDTFEHIPDHETAYGEALRVLKPGGILVMSVPAFKWLWGPHDVALMHQRRYTAGGVRGCLERAGFAVEKLSYSIFILFPVVVAVRLRDKFRRGPARVSLPATSDRVNTFLTKIQNWETRRIRKGRLPWGSSVIAVARKPQP